VRNSILLAALALALAADASATTYYFSGVLISGNAATQSTIVGQTAIPSGTPFDGWLTLDTSITTPSGGGDAQHRNYPYAAGDPPASFSFQVGDGLYDVTVHAVGNQVNNGYPGFGVGLNDAVWFWSDGATVGGSGQTLNPLYFDFEHTILLWISTPDGPLPTANVFDVAYMADLGAWEFAGLSLAVMQAGSNLELYRGAFTSFEVPEPNAATLAMAAVIALPLVGSRLRRRSA
jgi:hypothetical protein